MDEGTKNEEIQLEELSKKDIKRAEKENKKIKDGKPEGVPKIKEIYTNVEKGEQIKCETEREERLHEEYKKRRRKGRPPHHKNAN